MRFLALLLFFPSLAFGEWTTADTARQGVFTGLTIVDWAQTRESVKHPSCYPHAGNYCISNIHETGLAKNFIGSSPSSGQVNNYFAVSIIGHAAVSYLLPRDWREGWQYVWIGVEAETVRRNYAIGIRIHF